MTKQPDIPGPGEPVGPDNLQAEAVHGPIPDGEVLHPDPLWDRFRRTLELRPARWDETGDSPDKDWHSEIRRTGTDRDALQAVGAADDAPELRLDHSADDLQRETTFDPAQDNSGPQSDKG
ncbi:MAG TPA: hypothetical protein VMT24_09440 [Aggregatilineaceae bacterium]|nr:hypothetical protein [Aggregatilineaceae bacterium]